MLSNDNDVSSWTVYLEGPKDSAFTGGIFQLRVEFPEDYPDAPPVVRFLSEFWHPNVYPNGKVCMSTLHPPGDNAVAGETGDIRWRPIFSVSSIISSILLILQEPNFSSPANIDASVQWRNDWAGYKQRIARLCQLSAQEFRTNPSSKDVYIPHPDTNPADRPQQETKSGDEGDLDFDNAMHESSSGGGDR